ncbi:hypothetical protein TRVL_05777 [Trypanosoma vivax]|uniref:Fatty acyl-CoA reductase n=1 Tax=Trypanosoma vivax (strain Y486) TaxID=1055687 RepID=G0TZJ0_TRYVY|nr:hypothetical protein TRVL_05777 [Trypanosoma vivax]CCC50018.1 conserved hypothetical protein [Trypanosoma vivax Y486]
MSLDVCQGFSQKCVFVTGGSGFMGKVFLYKLLKECPDIGTIYVLMRGKTSRKLKRHLGPQERLTAEVLSSPCFDSLRAAVGEEAFRSLSARVVAVEGNITSNRLGLSERDCQVLLQSVNFIVHMAATVNFDEPLNVATEINTLGSLRVLALAKRCKNLEAMVHVSTCYVNYSRYGGVVEERLYAAPFDPQAMCKHILALSDKEVADVGRQLLKKYCFPNTYTFTKFIGEQLIYENKGDCPVVIVRPAIVGCSLKEPFPGWVDALTAAGGLLLTVGLGTVQEVAGRGDAVADIVPVDFVVNVIIKALFKTQVYYRDRRAKCVTGANRTSPCTSGGELVNSPVSGSVGLGNSEERPACQSTGASKISPCRASPEPQARHVHGTVALPDRAKSDLPFVYHACTSSSVNNLTWRRLRDASKAYWDWGKRHPRAIAPMNGALIESPVLYSLKFFFCREVPYHLLSFASELPSPIGSEKKRAMARRLGKAIFRAKDLNRQFYAFTSREWLFTDANTRSLDEGLNERSRAHFYFDTYMVKWWTYAQWYCHGVLKYVVGDTGRYEAPALVDSPVEIFRRASSL